MFQLREASKLLALLAAELPALQQLSIDGDPGLEMLQAFGSKCPKLTSFGEVLHSVPTLISQHLQQILPSLKTRTMTLANGDWNTLVRLVGAVRCPTCFDLCGRTMTCSNTLLVRGACNRVTISNGTIVVSATISDGMSVMCVDGGDMSLQNMKLVGMSRNGVNQHFKDAATASASSRWIGISIVNGGLVCVQDCEIQNSFCAINVGRFVETFDTSPAPLLPCKLVANHLKVRIDQTGSGIALNEFGCVAELTDCIIVSNIMEDDVIHIWMRHASQLIATRVNITIERAQRGIGLMVDAASNATLKDCNIICCITSCCVAIFVRGEGSLLCMHRCFSQGSNLLSEGGEIDVQ